MSAIDSTMPTLFGVSPSSSPSPPEHPSQIGDGRRLVVNGLTWEDYRRISDAFRGIQVRITYDRGKLEIMGTSLVLEVWNELLAMFVRVLAEEAQMTIRSAGHTTLERQDLDRSIEPD